MGKASRCEPHLACAPDFITRCFLQKRGKLMPFLWKRCFFCICPDITIHLSFISTWEDQGTWLRHFIAALLGSLAQEASAQRSWYLGSAATGSPGSWSVTASGELCSGPTHRASKSRSLCICSLRNSSLAVREIKCASSPYTLGSISRSWDGEASGP